MNFLAQNFNGLLQWQLDHPGISLEEWLKDGFRNPMSGFLRTYGVVCSKCGGKITQGNLKFFSWSANVECAACQGVEYHKKLEANL